MDSYTDTRRTLSWTWINAPSRRALTGLLLAIALVLVAHTATAAQSGWTVTDLGPEFDNSYALAINNAGQVVGQSTTVSAFSAAFL